MVEEEGQHRVAQESSFLQAAEAAGKQGLKGAAMGVFGIVTRLRARQATAVSAFFNSYRNDYQGATAS